MSKKHVSPEGEVKQLAVNRRKSFKVLKRCSLQTIDGRYMAKIFAIYHSVSKHYPICTTRLNWVSVRIPAGKYDVCFESCLYKTPTNSQWRPL